MSIDLTLHQTKASGPLMPTTLAVTLERLAKATRGRVPRAALRGRDLRLALDLSLDDDACAAITVAFEGQGARLRGTARGPSVVLLSWAFHTLASVLKGTLHDAEEDTLVAPEPDTYRSEAVAYLEAYERETVELRARHVGKVTDDEGSSDGETFLAWLAHEEHIALAGEGSATNLAALGASLPMHDASALYEILLESDAVDDVFVSETELSALLDRFRARSVPRR